MFIEKLNKPLKPHKITEKVKIESGLYEGVLQHDNVVDGSISIIGVNGLPIDTYTIEQNREKEWETVIRIHSAQPEATIHYESMGDTVDADDINDIYKKMKGLLAEMNEIVQEQQNKADKDHNHKGFTWSDLM